MGELPKASGYDWLLNNCCDLDQAAHAAHLDEGEYDPDCFHCQLGAGRYKRLSDAGGRVEP